MDVDLRLGDCLNILPTLPSESVDAVICDPPYPCIKRDYGCWTVDEWWAMMRPVVTETRRILKPTGSAVFILQPNSEHVGQMRGWLWEFMAWVCREWNMVQDVWWWNTCTLPTTHTQRRYGLLRMSIKSCVWLGEPNCYRNQAGVLWSESKDNARRRAEQRLAGKFPTWESPSGYTTNDKRARTTLVERGGVTPFNLLPIGASQNKSSHGASTPFKLVDWWTRYICPPGGTVADWFMGSGTMGVVAVQNECSFVGIEKMPGKGYFETAQERIAAAVEKAAQPKQLTIEDL